VRTSTISTQSLIALPSIHPGFCTPSFVALGTFFHVFILSGSHSNRAKWRKPHYWVCFCGSYAWSTRGLFRGMQGACLDGRKSHRGWPVLRRGK